MGRANVYLPDELERRVKAAGIAISEVCQRALLSAVQAAEAADQPLSTSVMAQYQRGRDDGARWARAASTERLLRLHREQQLDEIPADALPGDFYSLTQELTLAWEAGFVDAARAAIRAALSSAAAAPVSEATAGADEGHGSAAAQGAGAEPGAAAQQGAEAAPGTEAAQRAGAEQGAGAERLAGAEHGQSAEQASSGARTAAKLSKSDPTVLGDGSDCHIGVTLDGNPVSFDPHSAVRAGKSPLFAVLGQADLRARFLLSMAQDAAARGSGVVLVDLCGNVASRAAGLGSKVRVVGRAQPAAKAQFEELFRGGIGLGGLWETLAGLSVGLGIADLLAPAADGILEPGYVNVLNLAGDGAVGAALAVGQAAHALARSARSVEFPRLLLIDLPVGLAIPAAIGSRLGQIIKTARAQNAAVGLSAESAETVTNVGAGGALLSTVFAFATSSPLEAERLRDLLGVHAPILLNPPGMTTAPSDQTWVAMRDLDGRLGQVRLDG